jgi:hypothetical protein
LGDRFRAAATLETNMVTAAAGTDHIPPEGQRLPYGNQHGDSVGNCREFMGR